MRLSMVEDTEPKSTWWGTLEQVEALPRVNLLVMVVWFVLVAVVAINAGNSYGNGWAGFIGIFVGPLVLVRLMRSGLSARGGKRHRHEEAVK
jgi:fumarate reductase subunit C